jgi:hypothetical protein
MQDISWKLLELATLHPGITAKDAIDEGKLPYTHGSVKQAAAKLRREGLLWPSRPAWVLVARMPDDKARELLTDHERIMLDAAKAVGPMVQLDFLQLEALAAIPVTKRPSVLISLRVWGWIHPWNGLVKKPSE